MANQVSRSSESVDSKLEHGGTEHQPRTGTTRTIIIATLLGIGGTATSQAPAILKDNNEKVRADDDCIYEVVVPSASGSWYYYNNPPGGAEFKNVSDPDGTWGEWSDEAFGTEGQVIRARYPSGVSGLFSYGSDSNTGGANRTSEADPNVVCDSPLPLELLDFKVYQQGERVLAPYTTATRINTDRTYLDITDEDLQSFVPVDSIVYDDPSSYIEEEHVLETDLSRLDAIFGKMHSGEIVYLRLRNRDVDGTEQTSGLKALTIDREGNWLIANIYPNPVRAGSPVTIETGIEQGPVFIDIYDAIGQKIIREVSTGGSNEITIPQSLPQGIYYVRVYNNNGDLETQELIVE